MRGLFDDDGVEAAKQLYGPVCMVLSRAVRKISYCIIYERIGTDLEKVSGRDVAMRFDSETLIPKIRARAASRVRREEGPAKSIRGR